MNGFNDGIEAAAAALKDAAQLREQAGKTIEAAALHRMVSHIRALKRPEPTEAEKVERIAKAIARTYAGLKDGDDESPALVRAFEPEARAALAAMEGK